MVSPRKPRPKRRRPRSRRPPMVSPRKPRPKRRRPKRRRRRSPSRPPTRRPSSTSRWGRRKAPPRPRPPRRRSAPMAEIPARLVKQLRDETGAPMMDAKRALQESDGDLEAAKKLLRERGMAEAGKRAGRETPEGVVLARVEERVGTLVAVGCETEPVAKNAEFLTFAQKVLDAVAQERLDAVERLEEERKELVGRIGENVVVRGAARFEKEYDD